MVSAARLMAAAVVDTGPPMTAAALVTAEQAGESSPSSEDTTGRPGRLVGLCRSSPPCPSVP